jgi:hypothetical protein
MTQNIRVRLDTQDVMNALEDYCKNASGSVTTNAIRKLVTLTHVTVEFEQ